MRQCKKCGGQTDVYWTDKKGGKHIRYLKCVDCKETQQQYVPDEFLRTSRRDNRGTVCHSTS